MIIILLTLGAYFLIKKSVDVFISRVQVSGKYWVAGALAEFLLLYGIFYLLSRYNYGDGYSNLVLAPVLFAPVVFYEWYRSCASQTTNSEIKSIHFVSVPFILFLIVNASIYMQGASSSPEAIGWFMLGFLYVVPLTFLLPSIWIYFRERQIKAVASYNISQQSLQSESPITAKEDNNANQKYILIVILIGLLLFVGYNVFQGILTYSAIWKADNLEKQMMKEFQQEQQERIRKENVPPAPNPVFDKALIQAKNDLAAYLGVSVEQILMTSYKVDWSGVTGWNQSFCTTAKMYRISFEKDITDKVGDVRITDDQALTLSTTPKQEALFSFEIDNPLPTHMSFDYHFNEPRGSIEILIDGKKSGFESYIEGRNSIGYVKNKPIDEYPYIDSHNHLTPGKHKISIRLGGVNFFPDTNYSSSIEISNLYVGNVEEVTYLCVSPGSENRIATFEHGGKEYRYVFNENGKYFRTDGFR